ncbi:MAG: hypothetical protein HC888_12240 [Candidatus Competibacteraceae bacterium]|nr:hypothetical protein [Candidatus Competibacteraceae bacterium]
MKKKETTLTPATWTNGGKEVLILRMCKKDGSSSHGFVYPTKVGKRVTAKDWMPIKECGNGLHGWPWGLSLGDGPEPEYTDNMWIVLGALPKI